MNPKHIKLALDYPRVFRHFDPDATGYGHKRPNYYPSPFHERGFEHPNGWHDIITRLAQTLENLMTTDGVDIWCTQVKSKFGTLRFYIGGSNINDCITRVRAAIDAAENLSAITCEDCGKPGELLPNFWITTLCPECATQDLVRET